MLDARPLAKALGVKMKTILLILFLSMSNLAVAGEIAIFYLRQIPGDMEMFTLISNGKGRAAQLLSEKARGVRVKEGVFEELWNTFPSKHVEPYRYSKSGDNKINALHNHVLRVQQDIEGVRKEASFMIPHSSSPRQVTAWLVDFLRIFDSEIKVNEPANNDIDNEQST